MPSIKIGKQFKVFQTAFSVFSSFSRISHQDLAVKSDGSVKREEESEKEKENKKEPDRFALTFLMHFLRQPNQLEFDDDGEQRINSHSSSI